VTFLGERVSAGLGALVLVGALVAPQAARGQTVVEDGVVTRMEAAPARLEGIDVVEHLDERLPLDLAFEDTAGKAVTLREVMPADRPTIVTLNYSGCPMLCSLQLSGLTTALGKLDRRLGEDFSVVTVSLDPRETVESMRETAGRYHGDFARATGEGGQARAEAGWHFLRGTPDNVGTLAKALGVIYAYNEARREYVHPAVLILATPDGRVARYLYGIEYHPKTLSLSLVEAAQGKIGSSVDRFILYCFHYDETEGRYAPVAMNIMRVGGGLTAVALGTFLGAFWLKKERRRGQGTRDARGEGPSASAPNTRS